MDQTTNRAMEVVLQYLCIGRVFDPINVTIQSIKLTVEKERDSEHREGLLFELWTGFPRKIL